MAIPMWYWYLYFAPLLAGICLYLRFKHLQHRRSIARLSIAEKEGLTEPPSLHPVIDLEKCVRSGACAANCPEQALGVINGLGTLVNPSACIGHGACAASCPVEAITLVFGTERRGVDIPEVKPTFETNVPGIYIAGELGGMGLIGKSAEQGTQAVRSIAANAGDADLQLMIVGAGPAGMAATLTAADLGLRAITIEQEPSLGGTIYHYPRHKVVMTHPVSLPRVGKVRLGEIRKESLLDFWQGIVDDHGLEVQFGEALRSVERLQRGFRVTTTVRSYECEQLLLSIGRRGSPRTLGVPGEELPKVVYRLTDPLQYAGQRVLVVGGGDSALEAALALSEQPGTDVTLSYRSAAFSRAKPKNRARAAAAIESLQLHAFLPSTVLHIDEEAVSLALEEEEVSLENDAIIVCAGGILPMPMLREMGILVETKYGSA